MTVRGAETDVHVVFDALTLVLGAARVRERKAELQRVYEGMEIRRQSTMLHRHLELHIRRKRSVEGSPHI